MRMRSFQVCECGAPLHVNERETPKPEGAQVPAPDWRRMPPVKIFGAASRAGCRSAKQLRSIIPWIFLAELADDFDGRAHAAAHLVACDKLAQEQSRSEHCWKTVSGPLADVTRRLRTIA